MLRGKVIIAYFHLRPFDLMCSVIEGFLLFEGLSPNSEFLVLHFFFQSVNKPCNSGLIAPDPTKSW